MAVEEVPWGDGKRTLTKAYMLFLARWAQRLSWKETAQAFRTSWDKVSTQSTCRHMGLEHRTLGQIDAICAAIRRITSVFYWANCRAGTKKAAVAVVCWRFYGMIRDGSKYREQGADYFDRLHPERAKNKFLQRLVHLGFDVQLIPEIVLKAVKV